MRHCQYEPVQGTLFRDLLWDYQEIVTNLEWKLEDVWHFYNHRDAAENYIKEMKNGFGIDQFPTGNFMALSLAATQGLISWLFRAI